MPEPAFDNQVPNTRNNAHNTGAENHSLRFILPPLGGPIVLPIPIGLYEFYFLIIYRHFAPCQADENSVQS
jgi:hypothetical protein